LLDCRSKCCADDPIKDCVKILANFISYPNILSAAANRTIEQRKQGWQKEVSPMAFHIPFNQRRSKQQRSPVYIGFDPPRRKFNWWGFNGLWISLVSLLTLGFTSPVPLLISLNGLRRKKGPQKAAIAGTLLSLLGVAIASSIVALTFASHRANQHRRLESKAARIVAKQKSETQQLIAVATDELETYRDSHGGTLPSIIDSNMLVIKHIDPWGESLRFDGHGDHAIIRSAGPDNQFESNDDVTVKLNGNTDQHDRLLSL